MTQRKLASSIGLLIVLTGGLLTDTVAQDMNAPPDSLTISDTGQVGVGAATPAARLHTFENTDANTFIMVENASATGLKSAGVLRAKSNTATVNFQAHGSARTLSRFGQPLASWAEFLQVEGNGLIIGTNGAKPLILGTNAQNRVFISSAGNVGFGGVSNPTNPIQHFSGAKLTAGGAWTNASSRELKEKIHALTTPEAVQTLAGLQPVHFQYKAEPGEDYLGFVAEDVPEGVATADRKSLNPMDIVAVLTKVVQEQQRVMEEQQRAINQLTEKLAVIENAR